MFIRCGVVQVVLWFCGVLTGVLSGVLNSQMVVINGKIKQGHLESTDLRHGSSILGLSEPTIGSHIAFSPLYFIFLPMVIRITPNLFFMDPDSDPDHSHNLITCSLSHLAHILKISSKSVHNFLSYLSLKITFHGSRRSR